VVKKKTMKKQYQLMIEEINALSIHLVNLLHPVVPNID
jgi:hypothetical protein